MPTYEYRCPKGHLFEKTFSRITSQRHAKCPICGKRAQRLISGGAGVHFKGSGFYATDYGRGGKRKGEMSKDGDSASSDKSESKDKPAEKKAAEA